MENAPFIDNFPAINLDLWWMFLLKPPFSWNFMGTSKLIQLYMMEKIHYPFRLKEGSRERKHQTQTIWGWSVIVLCILNSFICHSIINFMRSLSLCVCVLLRVYSRPLNSGVYGSTWVWITDSRDATFPHTWWLTTPSFLGPLLGHLLQMETEDPSLYLQNWFKMNASRKPYSTYLVVGLKSSSCLKCLSISRHF